MFRSKRDVDKHVQDIHSKIKQVSERNLKGYSIAKLYFGVSSTGFLFCFILQRSLSRWKIMRMPEGSSHPTSWRKTPAQLLTSWTVRFQRSWINPGRWENFFLFALAQCCSYRGKQNSHKKNINILVTLYACMAKDGFFLFLRLTWFPCLFPGSGELQESLRAGPDQRPRPQDLRSHAGAADSARQSQVLGGGQTVWVV